jgi:dihydropteroate synthase
VTTGIKDTFFQHKKTLNLGGKIMDLTYPMVMGILNVTPDSFYDGGHYTDSSSILNRASAILEEGAHLIDLGGYSSRPGATDISEEEELKRVGRGLDIILKEFPSALVSIDTFRASVARMASDKGAVMINDISGGQLDPLMFKTVGETGLAYVMMHMRGTPQTMKEMTEYDNLLDDILSYFHERVPLAHAAGIKDLILDPGFGFAKTTEQNYHLLRELRYLHLIGLPILVGVSRKSMIYKTLNSTAEEALNGTTTLHSIALMNRVNILRVHDVKEAVETITLFKTTYN